jgi:ketosteroid isomerase-like protein
MFNRHDAKGFVQYYTPDADLVTVRGEVTKGTAEIEAGPNRTFLTRGSSQRTEIGALESAYACSGP